MAKGKSTWKYNKLLTARRNYFDIGGPKINTTATVNVPDKLQGLPTSVNQPNIFQSAGSDIATFFKNPGAAYTSPTGGITSMIGSAAGAIGQIGGQLLSNGLESKAGSIVSGVGDALGGVPILGGFAKGAFNLVGGGINALLGSKLNQANINAANTDIARMNSASSDASDFDALSQKIVSTAGRAIHNKSYYGRDGVFSNKVKNLQKKMEEEARVASERQNLALLDNARALTSNQLSSLEANYTAFGGPLDFGGGAIGYDFMNRYITAKESQAQGRDKSIASMPNSFALGGQTHGADFTNGMVVIDNGGSHESNPFEGVPMGVDMNGTPNLVEEGETIFNDYVFSKRLTVPKAIRNKYKLRGTKEMSFAEASKQMAKESDERPNDPISQRGLQALMSDLAIAQEQLKAKNQEGMFAYGGKVNKFSGEEPGTNQMNYDWNPFFTALSGYTTSRQKGKSAGKYMPDPHIPMEGNPYMLGAADIKALEGNDAYKAFTEAMIANPNMDYLRALDAGVAEGVPKLIGADGDLVSNWADLYRGRRNDGVGGIYHWTPTMASPALAPTEVVNTPAPTPESTPEVTPGTPGNKVRGKRFYYKGDDGKYVEYTGVDPTLYMKNNGYFATSTDSDNDYDNYYYDPYEEPEQGKYADWLRYAPAVGFGIGTLTDMLGITNKPDYSNADAILEATRSGGTYQPVSFDPIGNYLAYNPLDRDYYLNTLSAESGATRRAVMQNAGMNRGAGMAALLAADNNTQNQMGVLARQAEEYNLAQRQQDEEFNRSTNITNSQGFLQADIANQKAQAEMRDFSMKGTLAAAQMRDSERARIDAAKSANISGLFQTLGDIGYEEKNAKMRDWAIRHGVFGPISDVGRNRVKAAKGGKIKRRKGLTF